MWIQPWPPFGHRTSQYVALPLEQLDLVALVEEADLDAAQLVRHVQQADDVVADQPALAAVERTDEAAIERQARGHGGVADRIRLARLEERRAAPARHGRLGIGRPGDRRGRDRVGAAGRRRHSDADPAGPTPGRPSRR